MHCHPHPVLATVAVLEAALKDVADLNPDFMRTTDKQEALLRLSAASSRLEELRLRVLAASDDVAAEHGARDQAAWLAHRARLDRAECGRDLRLARSLERRRPLLAEAMRAGSVNRAQVDVVARALGDLPDDVGAEIEALAEERLVAEAAEFGPRALRILGRRVLEMVAPEVAEEHERRLLDRDDARARRRTFLTTRRTGDGATDIRIRLADAAADRLLTYLEAFTSPRRTPKPDEPVHDRRPYDQKLGHAFVAFLESVDPKRMPLHGGDATTVMVTGGDSEILAAWCEAHHAADPWAKGGVTDLADGLLLCSWHHHRAHDHRYDARRLPSGDVRFNRRT